MQEIRLEPHNLKDQLDKLQEPQLQEIVQHASNWDEYRKYTRMMNEIAWNMKETPEIPSEKPKDINALTKVEFPEEGGILTYMQNFPYPYRGYPHYEFVEKIDAIKKTSRAFVSGLYHQLKGKNKLWFVTLIPSLWIMKDLVRAAVYVNYRLISRFKIKPLRYSKCCRELYRSFSIPCPKEKYPDFREQIRDVLCMLLEMDNAYRFRFQDLLAELDQKKIQRDPVREVLRLLDVLQARELKQEVKDTWTLVRYLVNYYVRFDKRLKAIISHVFSQINLQQMVLDDWDKIYCAGRKDYTFGFQISPTENDRKLIRNQELAEQYKEEEGKIREESTKAHQEGGNMSDLDAKYEKLLNDAKMRYETQKHELGLF